MFRRPSLRAGTFKMTAKYLGNASFNAALSPVYSQVVTP